MADNFNLRSFLTENKLTKNAQLLNEGSYTDNLRAPFAQDLGGKMQIIAAKYRGGYSGIIDYLNSELDKAQAEAGEELSRSDRQTLVNYGNNIIRNSFEMEREGVENDEPVMEVEEKEAMQETLTAKERRLVEMVQDALGVTKEVHQNADPNVPNDSTDMAIDMMKNGLPEGDNMVQEKSLPKYENIEKLMQEIEAGTNEAAHSYKKKRMKEIAEMLEAKVGSLEEGEGADFVDAKKVKQMKKDIMTLRKQAEKLEKEYEKKFAKKEEKKEEK